MGKSMNISIEHPPFGSGSHEKLHIFDVDFGIFLQPSVEESGSCGNLASPGEKHNLELPKFTQALKFCRFRDVSDIPDSHGN